MKGKKGQEEIIGFVLIMVIVAIVFLVFLGISLRTGQDVERGESLEARQFLESSMEYTSECKFSSAPDYYTLSELFEECFTGNNCLEGEDSCQVLNETLKKILDASFSVAPESSIKGYEFDSKYLINTTSKGENILTLKAGNCENAVRGSTYLIPAFPGRIENSFILCF